MRHDNRLKNHGGTQGFSVWAVGLKSSGAINAMSRNPSSVKNEETVTTTHTQEVVTKTDRGRE